MANLDISLKCRLFPPMGPAFPVHPLCIAYVIMHKYESLAEALRRPAALSDSDDVQAPNALSDGDIPGAGGTVWAALDTLKLAARVSLDEAVEFGNDYWKTSESRQGNEHKFAAGQRQADDILAAFREKASRWCHPPMAS